MLNRSRLFVIFLLIFFCSAAGFAIAIDTSFSAADARVLTGIGGFADGRKVLVQPDGKVLVAGNTFAFGDFKVVRFNPDGSLDTSFDGDGLVTLTMGIQSSTLLGAALQSDGKILLVGDARGSNATGSDFGVARLLPNGTLDTNFGNGGRVITPFVDNSSDYAADVAVQPDGRIVVSGQSSGAFAVVRYTQDGSLDATFSGGKVTTSFGAGGAVPGGLVLQPDGKIVIGGAVQVDALLGQVTEFALARYNADGVLDSTFDGDGKLLTSADSFAACNDLVLQSDGKLIAVGRAILNGSPSITRFVMFRFDTTGALDSSFGTGGVVKTLVGGRNGGANSAILQPDGRVVLAGQLAFPDPSGANNDFGLIRYNVDGSLDPSFGRNGSVITSVAVDDNAKTLALLPDGKLIVAGGAAGVGGGPSLALVRYQPNGALDQSFGRKVPGRITAVIRGAVDEAASVLVQPDGKIIVAGRSRATNRYYFSLARFNADGMLDAAFGDNGTVYTKIGTGDSDGEGRAVALQSDGKIVVVGRLFDANNTGGNESLYYFAAARYNPDGSLDNSFDGDGITIVSAPNEDNQAYAVAIQSDGKIVIGGYFDTLPGLQRTNILAVVRLNQDGSLDNSFDLDGIVTTDVTGELDTAYAVLVQPDGKILVGGSTGLDPSSFYVLIRYNSDGTLDGTFGTGGIMSTLPGGQFTGIRSLALQPDGRILAAASARLSGQNDFAVVRFNPNGSIDSSFGVNGRFSLSMGGNSADFATAMVLLPSGKMIAVGNTTAAANPDIALVGINSNGTVDTTFGTNGVFVTDYAPLGNSGETATAAVLGPGGALFVAGSLSVGSSGTRRDYLLAKYRIAPKTSFDFDGDGRTDIGIFRPSTGEWFHIRSSDLSVRGTQFGNSEDKIVPGDYDGDGRTDVAVWRPSTGAWYILPSSTSVYYGVSFGSPNDIPSPGDFDGDGKTDLAVFRPSDGNWYFLNSTTGFSAIHFGADGDLPVVGDYDGDGRADIGIYRTVGTDGSGIWYLNRSTAGLLGISFGAATDKPVVGDFTGDGKADITVWRPSNGVWYGLRSEDGSFTASQFGIATDIPAAGDYDGDGKSDLAVFRPSTGTWFVQATTAGFIAQPFGASADRPVPAAFVP